MATRLMVQKNRPLDVVEVVLLALPASPASMSSRMSRTIFGSPSSVGVDHLIALELLRLDATIIDLDMLEERLSVEYPHPHLPPLIGVGDVDLKLRKAFGCLSCRLEAMSSFFPKCMPKKGLL